MDPDYSNIRLFRKRYLPEENVLLKDDTILLFKNSLIITKWAALHPRKDIARGISAYFPDDFVKVSKVFDHQGRVVHWYCDIIELEHEPGSLDYIFQDLLIDVLVYEDGSVRVMDLDEVGCMLKEGRLNIEKAALALGAADRLLKTIYDGSFSKYQAVINQLRDPS